MVSIREMKWAGVALSLLVPAVLAAPASAVPAAVRGIVTEIDEEANRVTLEQPWGEPITIDVSYWRRNRPGPFDPLMMGTDTAIVLMKDMDEPVAKKVCTCVAPIPAFVAVEPIAMPVLPEREPFTEPPLTPRPFTPAPAPAPAPIPALW
ncbi:hypothetical protein [Trichothermofontia sp.]